MNQYSLVPTLCENEETYRSKGPELTDGVRPSPVSINNQQCNNQLLLSFYIPLLTPSKTAFFVDPLLII
jgi:hypothetical protein